MIFPKIDDVANEIYRIASVTEEEIDIRLQVYSNGKWFIRVGSSQYDLDHSGYWGVSYISFQCNPKEIARELLAQAKEDFYSDYGC